MYKKPEISEESIRATFNEGVRRYREMSRGIPFGHFEKDKRIRVAEKRFSFLKEKNLPNIEKLTITEGRENDGSEIPLTVASKMSDDDGMEYRQSGQSENDISYDKDMEVS